ncbi:MAG: glycoside hydrolase family 3 C-terminal domain-containing protein [Clostridia bacterium]|nr:glycoside hydrolase family 3 C-terminal domain-containing protein [Clostridia bacterium]
MVKKILGRKTLLRLSASVFTMLFALVLSATGLAFERANFINGVLGTGNYKIYGLTYNDQTMRYKSDYENLSELVSAREKLMREIAEEGSVLLKNDGALPLEQGKKVTLLGIRSHDPVYGGSWGGSRTPTEWEQRGSGEQYASFEDSVRERYAVNETMISFYSEMQRKYNFYPSSADSANRYVTTGEVPLNKYLGETELRSVGVYNDAAFVVIGRQNRENADFAADVDFIVDGEDRGKGYGVLGLSENERSAIEFAKDRFEKVIVILNCDAAMEIDELKNDDGVNAILWVGAPGVSFKGAVDVICGKDRDGNDLSPSGRFTDTYAVNSTGSPAMQNFGNYLFEGKSREDLNKGGRYVVESEGVYVGYKYYETRYADTFETGRNAKSSFGAIGPEWDYNKEVSYPFGFGLSYTEFKERFSSINLDWETGIITVSGTVENIGDHAGKDVLELYVQLPYTEYDIKNRVEKPAVKLIGFTKTRTLFAGESSDFIITASLNDLTSYDYTEAKTYIFEEGTYYFSIGNGAHEALNNILAYQGKTGLTDIYGNPAETVTDNVKTVNTNGITGFDPYRYSLGADGEKITNEFEFADLNNLCANVTVEYFTRSDWSKGWKTYGVPISNDFGYLGSLSEAHTPNVKATAEMELHLNNGSVTDISHDDTDLVWGSKETNYKLIDMYGLSFDDDKWNVLLNQITLEEACRFIREGSGGWKELPSICAPASRSADGPIGIASDQRGSYDKSWSGEYKGNPYYVSKGDEYSTYCLNTFPTEPVVASTFNAELIKRQGNIIGNDSLWHNIPTMFSPAINIHRTPYMGRTHEYYSEDSVLTSLIAESFCEGAENTGVQLTAKHFAFNEQEDGRIGLATFLNEQAAREIYLRPFETICRENKVAGLMTSFNRAGCIWSGASKELQINVLRKEWGYIGSLISDAVDGVEAANVMNWWDNLLNGGGVMLVGHKQMYSNARLGVLDESKVKGNAELQSRMKEVLHYTLYQEVNSNQINGLTEQTVITKYTNWWQITLIAANVIFGVLSAVCLGAYIYSISKERRNERS